jgi:hypothetical protein
MCVSKTMVIKSNWLDKMVEWNQGQNWYCFLENEESRGETNDLVVLKRL